MTAVKVPPSPFTSQLFRIGGITLRHKEWEKGIERVFLISALVAIGSVALITVFIIREGMPAILREGLGNFLGGVRWDPDRNVFGILPMIAGTFAVTAGALLIGVPLSIASAIFLSEIASNRVRRIIRPGIELLAGIPSVIYGFYGLVVLIPLIRDNLGGPGFSVLAGSIILAIMIIPTIVNITEDAIRAVPRDFKEGSLAMGATHWQTIKHVILPAASSGIVTAVVLGMGRAMGETMAVIMVTANVPRVPSSWLSPVRTLTGNIAIEMGYASGDHRQTLFATGMILFLVIMALNLTAGRIARKAGEGND